MKNFILSILVISSKLSEAGCGYSAGVYINATNNGFPIKLALGGSYNCPNQYVSGVFSDSQNQVLNPNGGVIEINEFGIYNAITPPYGPHNIKTKAEIHILDSLSPEEYIIITKFGIPYDKTISYFYGKTFDAFKKAKTIDKIEVVEYGKIKIYDKPVYLRESNQLHRNSNIYYYNLDTNKTESIRWLRNGIYLNENSNTIDISEIYTGYFYAEITNSKGYIFNTDTIFCEKLKRIDFLDCIDSNLVLLSKCSPYRKGQLQESYGKLFLPKSNPIQKSEYNEMLVCTNLEIEIVLINYLGIEVYRRKKIYYPGLNKIYLFDDYTSSSGLFKMMLIANSNFATTRNIIIEN
jgi:hypothetical protein